MTGLPPTERPLSTDLVAAGVAAAAASVVALAVAAMDWASRTTGGTRTTYRTGPVGLVLGGALVAASLSVAVAVLGNRWLRRAFLVVAGVTFLATVVLAGSRIAAANRAATAAPGVTATDSGGNGTGPTVTSYEAGAAVGVIAAGMLAAASGAMVLAELTATTSDPPRRRAPLDPLR